MPPLCGVAASLQSELDCILLAWQRGIAGLHSEVQCCFITSGWQRDIAKWKNGRGTLLGVFLSCCLMSLQLDQQLAERDWRWHLERSYTLSLANHQVELFFIDTSPFVQEYQTAVWSVNEGKLCLLHSLDHPHHLSQLQLDPIGDGYAEDVAEPQCQHKAAYTQCAAQVHSIWVQSSEAFNASHKAHGQLISSLLHSCLPCTALNEHVFNRGHSGAVVAGKYEGVGGEVGTLKGHVEDCCGTPSDQVSAAGEVPLV